MKTTITLDSESLTSKIDTNNFFLKTTSELILIGFIGMTILFTTYIFQNPSTYKEDFILYVIFWFMIIISFGVGYNYYFQKGIINNTLALIVTAQRKEDTH